MTKYFVPLACFSAILVIGAPEVRAQQIRDVELSDDTTTDLVAAATLRLISQTQFNAQITLDRIKAALPMVKWYKQPKRVSDHLMQGDTQIEVGQIGNLVVTISEESHISSISYNFQGNPGHPRDFNLMKSLQKYGFDVKYLYCSLSATEGSDYYFIKNPSYPSAVISAYSFNAPTAAADVRWAFTHFLAGKVPTPAEARENLAVERCAAVARPAISYKQALKLAQEQNTKSLSGGGAQPRTVETVERAIYSGTNRYGSVSNRVVVDLTRQGTQISANVYTLFGHVVAKRAVSGSYVNGICTLNFPSTIHKGRCTADSFQGEVLEKGWPTGDFSMTALNGSDIPRFNPAEPFAISPGPSTRLQVAAQPTARSPLVQQRPSTHAPPSPPEDDDGGWLDYVKGTDPIPQQRSTDTPTWRGRAPLPAPSGTRWFYGRDRWVVMPGERCRAEEQLVKGYCFGAVMSYLRSHPSERNVAAVMLSAPASLGTWISNDTPIRYHYVDINRDGDKLTANKTMHGSTKAKANYMCDISPIKDGFFLMNPGPTGLKEAALYRCEQ